MTERRKKPWEKPGTVGGPFLLWPDDTAVQFQLLQSQIGWLNRFPRSFPDGSLGDGVLTGGLSLNRRDQEGMFTVLLVSGLSMLVVRHGCGRKLKQ